MSFWIGELERVKKLRSTRIIFDEFVWVTTHDFMVFASTRLAFIRIDDELPGSNELTRASAIN